MFRRLLEWSLFLIVAANQFIQIFLSGPNFIIFGGKLDEDWTMSAKVGRAYQRNKLWGKLLQPVINTIFKFVLNEDDHCFKSYEKHLRKYTNG